MQNPGDFRAFDRASRELSAAIGCAGRGVLKMTAAMIATWGEWVPDPRFPGMERQVIPPELFVREP